MAGEIDRFTSAATSGPPSDEQRALVALHQEVFRATAHVIEQTLPEGRLRSLAFTTLEESLMWANKAVFQ